jgi:hypothetical protein
MHPFVRFAYLAEKHEQESVSFLTPCYKLQTSNCYHLLDITPTVRQGLGFQGLDLIGFGLGIYSFGYKVRVKDLIFGLGFGLMFLF